MNYVSKHVRFITLHLLTYLSDDIDFISIWDLASEDDIISE